MLKEKNMNYHQSLMIFFHQPRNSRKDTKAVESPFVYLELMQVSARQIGTPLVCAVKRSLAMKMDHPTLSTLNHQGLLVNQLSCQ